MWVAKRSLGLAVERSLVMLERAVSVSRLGRKPDFKKFKKKVRGKEVEALLVDFSPLAMKRRK